MSAKRLNIGLRQANRLCNMKQHDRLDFLAEGLPLILKSAQGFWEASVALKDKPREAEVLRGFATEEAAKILILMDLVRCPKRLLLRKISTVIGWFYDHMARLIYAEAISWKPMHVNQLRDYVNESRKAHYLEGDAGEYILPNWSIYQRESQLYVDIEAYEGSDPRWSEPSYDTRWGSDDEPLILRLVQAMSAVGMFTRRGLKITSEVWSRVEFKDTQGWQEHESQTRELWERLIEEKLPLPEATQGHVDDLFRFWQLPMYDFDFSPISVPLEELKKEQERLFWSEYGGM